MTLKEKPSGFPRHRWGRAPHETDAARLATLGVAWLATCAARRVVEHDAGRRRARRVCIPSTRAIALKPINLGPATIGGGLGGRDLLLNKSDTQGQKSEGQKQQPWWGQQEQEQAG